MSLFELDGGRLVPAQFGRTVEGALTEDVLETVRSQVLEIVGRPLFPVTWRDMSRRPDPGEPRLTALDAAGQIVSVEVHERLDSSVLIDSLSRLADIAALSWTDLAREYPGDIEAFKAGWLAFRDSMPPSSGSGPRLVMVVGEIDPVVRPALDVLAASGVEVHEMALRRMSSGRSFLDVRTVGPRMYAHAAQTLSAGESSPRPQLSARASVTPARPEAAAASTPRPFPSARPVSAEGGAGVRAVSADVTRAPAAPSRPFPAAPSRAERSRAAHAGSDVDRTVGHEPVPAPGTPVRPVEVAASSAHAEPIGIERPTAPAPEAAATHVVSAAPSRTSTPGESAAPVRPSAPAVASPARAETGVRLGAPAASSAMTGAHEHPAPPLRRRRDHAPATRTRIPALPHDAGARGVDAHDQWAAPHEAASHSAADVRAAESARVRQARDAGVPVLDRDSAGLEMLARLTGEDVPLVLRRSLDPTAVATLTTAGVIRVGGEDHDDPTQALASLGHIGLDGWQEWKLGDHYGPSLGEALDEVNVEIVREFAAASHRSRRA